MGIRGRWVNDRGIVQRTSRVPLTAAIGGRQVRKSLEGFLSASEGLLRNEILLALECATV